MSLVHWKYYKMDAQKLLIFDLAGWIYPPLYAYPGGETNAQGIPVKGPNEFFRRIFDVIFTERPYSILWAGESSRANLVRTQIYPKYKANRTEKDPVMVEQAKLIQRVLRELQFSVESVAQWEADDVIASICANFCDAFDQVVIASDDKDMDQLLTHQNVVRRKKDGSKWNQEDAKKRWEANEVEDIRQIQALSGDSADNIPGVKGVGLVKASELIKKYKTARATKEAAAEQTPALRRSLEEYDVSLNLKLVTLNPGLPVPQELPPWSPLKKAHINQTLSRFGLFAAL